MLRCANKCRSLCCVQVRVGQCCWGKCEGGRLPSLSLPLADYLTLLLAVWLSKVPKLAGWVASWAPVWVTGATRSRLHRLERGTDRLGLGGFDRFGQDPLTITVRFILCVCVDEGSIFPMMGRRHCHLGSWVWKGENCFKDAGLSVW